MAKPLNILIVEDSETDAFLLQRTLQKGGFEITCEVVDTPEAMRSALLSQKNWDVITSDHSMPHFSALDSLALAKEICPDVPFNIISGQIDINLAVSLMKSGAQDYIQKREMELVIPAIERELREVELRRDQKRISEQLKVSDDRFKAVLENSLVASYKKNIQTNNYEYYSPVITHITGYTPDEMNSFSVKEILTLFHPADVDETNRLISESLSGDKGSATTIQYRFKHKMGHYVWLEDKYSVMRDSNENPLTLIGYVHDITEHKKAEESLRESEEKYQRLFETAGAGIGYYSPDGVVISYNNMAAQNMGGKPEDFVGRSIYELFPIAAADVYMDRIQKAVNSKHTQEYEDLVDLPGEPKYFLSTFTRVLSPTDQILGVQIISSDISKRKQQEESLRETEELFRTVFESSIVGICMVGVDGRFFKVNDYICTILGYSREELITKIFFDVTLSEDKEISTKKLHELLSGKILNSNFEKRYIRKDGNVIWVNVSISAIHDKYNTVQYFITYIQDINERKLAEKKLQENEEKFSKVFHEAPVWISITDLMTGTYIDVNEGALRGTGFSRDEVIGHTAAEIGWITSEERLYLVQEIQEHERITDLEMIFHAKNGNILHGLVNGEQIEVNGRSCLLTVTIDITDRKLAEETKQNSEIKFRQMFEVSPVGIVMVGFNRRFIHCNPEFLQFLGYEGEEIVGKLIEDVTLPEDCQIGKAEMAAILKGEIIKSQVNKRYLRKDGQVVWGETTISLVRDTKNCPQYFLANIQDITERKLAEEVTKNIITMNPVSIQILDKDGFTLEINPAFKTLFNSVPPAGYSIFSDPQLSQKGIGEIFDKLRQGEVVHFPDVSFNPHDSIPEMPDVPNWIRTIGFPLYFSNKKPDRFVLMQENITERKLGEEKNKQLKSELEQRVMDRTAQLENANKELESFSYSVSHDLRAPLRGIDGFSLALKEDYIDKLDDTAIQYIDHVRRESQRMNQLIDDLLKLSHFTSTVIELKMVNLSDLAQTIVARLQQDNPNHKAEFQIQTGIIANGDPNLLEIVLTNLLGNAYKYSSKVSNPIIQFGQDTTSGEPVYFVRDNGVGFNMEYAQKLFGAFQRMHNNSEFEGTGVGLATVKRIINKHNGKIWADAKKNEGAIFYFTLPFLHPDPFDK
jgi:PAS domain S-box-containing protein